MIHRRQFIRSSGMAAAGIALTSHFAFAGEPVRKRKIRMGIIGGRFGAGFYFHEHPNCIVEAVSDLRADRRAVLENTYRCKKSYESLEKLLQDRKIDAVFIATPAPDHVRHAVAALEAGKHVLCAVPAAMTLEECEQLRSTVQRTGLTYMMAETTTYRQNTISVKKMYHEGDFGTIFSAAAEYNHPGLEVLYMENGTPTWRHGFPPMHYPTHCTAFLIAVTGERLTEVSCLGWGDESPALAGNPYNNPFWNETAFFKTNRGTPFRVEVNWKGALREVERGEWRGDKMSFFSAMKEGEKHTIVHAADTLGRDDAGFVHKSSLVEEYNQPKWWQTELLPEPLRHDSGHDGSHTFITHEFINALIHDRKPEVDVHEAIAYTAPGIVAHQSALRNGETLKVPSFD